MRLFKYMNVAGISKTTYYRHSRQYVQAAVILFWKIHQLELVKKLILLGIAIIIAVDGRCDSPGTKAKFGSTSAIEMNVNKVLDVQLVQVIYYSITFQ